MASNTRRLTPATTQTTRLLWPMMATRTARLRAALRRIDGYAVLIAAILLLLFGYLAIQQRPPVAAPRAAQPIIVLRDRVVVATPTLGLPAAAMVEQVAPAPAADEATPVPAAPAEQPAPDLQVMHAPEPTIEAYWQDSDTFVVNGSAVPTVAPDMIGHIDSQGWVCGTKYGDWRDENPMYTHPECYAK